MRHTLFKAYALGMCLLALSVLALTCSGPAWETFSDRVVQRVNDNNVYRFYTMQELCHDCGSNNLSAAPATIGAYREGNEPAPLEMDLEVAEADAPSIFDSPLWHRLGIALIAAFVGFNHWRLFRYLSQPLA